MVKGSTYKASQKRHFTYLKVGMPNQALSGSLLQTQGDQNNQVTVAHTMKNLIMLVVPVEPSPLVDFKVSRLHRQIRYVKKFLSQAASGQKAVIHFNQAVDTALIDRPGGVDDLLAPTRSTYPDSGGNFDQAGGSDPPLTDPELSMTVIDQPD